MTSLLSELTAIAGTAFAAENLSAAFGQVQLSDRPDLAQFQCNGALTAAKQAKANPRHIAERIRTRLNESGLFEDVSIAGPGFINLRLKDHALEQRLQRLASRPEAALPESGRGKTLVLDFGGPNIAKPMHVAICGQPSLAIACSGCFAPTAGRWSAMSISATGDCRWAN